MSTSFTGDGKMVLIRENRFGLIYKLTEVDEKETLVEIPSMGKSLRLNANINDLNKGWYLWINGNYVQQAFFFLTPNEREFFVTGMTPDDWDVVFKGNEEDEDDDDAGK